MTDNVKSMHIFNISSKVSEIWTQAMTTIDGRFSILGVSHKVYPNRVLMFCFWRCGVKPKLRLKLAVKLV